LGNPSQSIFASPVDVINTSNPVNAAAPILLAGGKYLMSMLRRALKGEMS
jgi:hypothetical protein